MPIVVSKLASAVVSIGILLAGAGAHAAGFQRGVVDDPGGHPLVIGIWHPSHAVARPVSMGPTTMTVAIDAPVSGDGLPLIVMSHGTGGSYLGHFDTAMALADAGFVVVAMNHAGDNHADQSRSVDIMDRPRQVSRVIDHMLSSWQGRASIDPGRVGMFGFSAGGFTTLAIVGGVPDLTKIPSMCQQHPGDFACRLLSRREHPVPAPASLVVADARVKAAVVAAPALGFTFSPDGLKGVTVPVQLWRAESDVILPHPRYAEAVRLALPGAPDYHVVPNAGHFDFLAPCSDAFASMAPALCTSAADFDRPTFHARFNSKVAGFFEKTLVRR